MESALKFQPTQAEEHPLIPYLKGFYDKLPHKPYCTDELGVTHIRPKETAIRKRYLQINQPAMAFYLIFDIDIRGGAIAWMDCGLPAPLWSTMNRQNTHAHLVYLLDSPVCVSEVASLKATKYLAAIESAMTDKLGADRSYSGLLTKNPLNPAWQTTVWSQSAYPLDELADYLELRGHPKLRGIESTGLGRNVELFENVRKWAYKAIRRYWAPDYRDGWFDAVYERVEAINAQFSEPLPVSEVKSIAKSIARWTHRHFSPSAFRQNQAQKGRKGGRAAKGEAKSLAGAKGGANSKGGGRPALNQPWVELGISRATYFRRCKAKNEHGS